MKSADVVETEHRFNRQTVLQLPARLQNFAQSLSWHVIGTHSQKEAIEECAKGVVLGQMIARTNEGNSWECPRFPPAPENAFVQSHEEAIENGAIRVQKFIEKDERRLRQHALGVRHQIAIAQTSDIERAKELVGFGKAGKHIVEGLTVQPPAEFMNKRTFCR